MKNPNIIGNWNQLYKILVKKIELSKAFKVYFPNKKLIENNESLKHHVNNFENRTTRSILRHFNIYPENSPKKTYNALFKKVKEEIIKIIQRMIIDEEPKPTPEKLKELIINKIELKKCPSYISDPLISSLKKSKTSSTIERSGCRDLSLLTQLLPSSDDEDPDDLKTPRSSENSEESKRLLKPALLIL
ncbi:unnamed protein product [Moneuplotes crassus]|uniref:Uncharacterized protein n=1 Tax=Euplotes crassus TaxID=5936 RepID=A0AAD2D5Q7_EUPCR|nr:unnamed protein product [Moneuplotes crassus]